MAAVKQYINQQKACNNNDLSDCLLKIYNSNNDVKKCLFASNSTITRIKQQYKSNTVRAQRKSYNKSTVDDTTISSFQQKLIDTLNDYNRRYLMNSDQKRIQQSMPLVYTVHQTGKPPVINITYVSILIQILVRHAL